MFKFFNFDNIGEKIKILAKVICALGIASSLGFGVNIIKNKEVLLGITCIIVGIIISWISVYFMYGFGDLISNINKIANDKTGLKQNVINEKNSKLEETEKTEFINENIKEQEKPIETWIYEEENSKLEDGMQLTKFFKENEEENSEN